MKKTFMKLGVLSLFAVGVIAHAQSTGKVGVNTEDPKETLDVKGTAKVQDLPESGNGNSYNGTDIKNMPFNATKTVVADNGGVLGSLPYILPAGTANNTSLKWDNTTKKWITVAPEAQGVDTSLANTNQTITQGEQRNVEVNGNNTTLTFSSNRNINTEKNVFNFKKNHETLAIKPNENDEASYIGFHKSNADDGDFIGYIGRAGRNHDDITLAATTSDAKVVLNGTAGVKISNFPDGSKNALLATGTDGIVRKITGSNGQVLKHNGTTWEAVADTDTDTSLANTDQTITSGQGRQVQVNGASTTLTFSSTRDSDKNVVNFEKDNETIAVKPRTANNATYIGFHKSKEDNFTGYIGHGSANGKDITVSATDTAAKVVLNGGAGVQISNFPTGSKNALLATGTTDGIVRQITGTTNGQVLKYNGTNWEAGSEEKSPWFVQNTSTSAKETHNNTGIYHRSRVGIGDFSSTAVGAELEIKGGGTSQLRLTEDRADPSKMDISTESFGFSITNRKSNALQGRHLIITNEGDFVVGKQIQNGQGHSNFKTLHFDRTNARLGVGVGAPTQGIDVAGKARIREMDNATTADVPVYVDANGVLKKGTAGASSAATGGAWLKVGNGTEAVTLEQNKGGTEKAYFKGGVGIGDFSGNGALISNLGALTVAQREEVKLGVKGAVLAGSYKGTNGATMFPDYVFQKYYTGTSFIKADYNFNTLSQVEQFVKQNGHLPGYKSAKTIKEQGYIDLMDTQITNVEKIEELYLHSIEQDKKLKEQAAEIAELKELVKQLLNKK